MDYEGQMKDVEEVLSKFPIDARENYYRNKETLQIDYLPNLDVAGSYEIVDNRIKLREPLVLEHELFHMATSDKSIFEKNIGEGLFYCAGLSYFDRSNICYGVGLDEGFVESLAEMAEMGGRGNVFEAYIANLLVSIYGEILYTFPLTNNFVGFYDCCSKNIQNLRKSLDFYHMYITQYNKKLDLDIDKSNPYLYVISKDISSSIKNVVIEYNSYKKPHVTRIELKNQMEKLLEDKKFWEFYRLLPIKDTVEQEIASIISTELISKKYMIQEKAQKIKKFLHFS